MNIRDVAIYEYPGQVESGNIEFGMENPEGPIFVTKWNVPNVERPSREYLESLIPKYEQRYNLEYFLNMGKLYLTEFLDSVAREKKYASAISCASYLNSKNVEWKGEASIFLEWRDAIYAYVIEQTELMSQGKRPVPTFEEFKKELPVIKWA